jgi:phosphatidylglycerophosphate synthase
MTNAYQSGDRRPIASRTWKFSGMATRWLVARGVSANSISMAGLLAGLLAGACLAGTAHVPEFTRILWLGGAIFVQLRLLANMLDGMVAIESKRASPLGELFNEIPDRISDSAVLIGLGIAGNLPLGLGAALAAMLTAYVRAVGKVAGAHQDFSGPMAKPQRMFLITLLALFSAFAPGRWQNISGVPLVNIVLVVIIVGSVGTAWRRLARIARALRMNQS